MLLTYKKISIFPILLLLLFCCKPQTQEENNNKQNKSTKAVKSKGSEKADIWAYSEKTVPLTSKETKQVRKVYSKYKKKINSLKKNKKWKGAQNETTRIKLRNDRVNDVKSILKNKYSKFMAVRKEWNEKE